MSTSRGKIGRLPVEIRLEVNGMIRDNKTAEAIQKFLNAKGIKDVSPQNISSWKTNGYQEWLRRQDRIEGMSDRMRARREFAVQLTKEAKADGDPELAIASNSASDIAVDTIEQVLEDFDPELLKAALAEKPEKFMGLVDSLAMLRKGDQSFIKLRMDFDEYRSRNKSRLDELSALAGKKGGATAHDIKTIFKEAYGV